MKRVDEGSEKDVHTGQLATGMLWLFQIFPPVLVARRLTQVLHHSSAGGALLN